MGCTCKMARLAKRVRKWAEVVREFRLLVTAAHLAHTHVAVPPNTRNALDDVTMHEMM